MITRNRNSRGHIITIEDPIEFVHAHANCIVTQREIGTDTENWDVALRKQSAPAPDVITIGEIRDRDAMDHAIASPDRAFVPCHAAREQHQSGA